MGKLVMFAIVLAFTAVVGKVVTTGMESAFDNLGTQISQAGR